MSDRKAVIVALDFASGKEAIAFSEQLDPTACRLKVGKELFTQAGPELVRTLQTKGFDIFLDLKFHDIPATVGKAVAAAVDLGVWMVNVHASGGSEMLKAAAAAVQGSQTKLIAVTVLTSMSEEQLQATGVTRSLDDQVKALAESAADAGLDGVVCSAREALMLKATLGDKFLLVTPGIRPAGAANNDQHRVMTPAEAIKAGVDYLVIGRPIRQAKDPQAALQLINQEVLSANS